MKAPRIGPGNGDWEKLNPVRSQMPQSTLKCRDLLQIALVTQIHVVIHGKRSPESAAIVCLCLHVETSDNFMLSSPILSFLGTLLQSKQTAGARLPKQHPTKLSPTVSKFDYPGTQSDQTFYNHKSYKVNIIHRIAGVRKPNMLLQIYKCKNNRILTFDAGSTRNLWGLSRPSTL